MLTAWSRVETAIELEVHACSLGCCLGRLAVVVKMKKLSRRKELQRQIAKGDRAARTAMIVALPAGALVLVVLILQYRAATKAGSHDYYSDSGLLDGIIYAAVFMFVGAFSLWRFARFRRKNDQDESPE